MSILISINDDWFQGINATILLNEGEDPATHRVHMPLMQIKLHMINTAGPFNDHTAAGLD